MTIRLAPHEENDAYVVALKLSVEPYTLAEMAYDLDVSELQTLQILESMHRRGLVRFADDAWHITDVGRAAV